MRKKKVTRGLFLCAFFGFRPSRFSGLSSAPRSLFIGHRFKSAFAADPAALGSHVTHDLLNDAKFHGFRSFQKNPAGVLDGIEFFDCAFPLWHTPKRGTKRRNGQDMPISNRPTTETFGIHGW